MFYSEQMGKTFFFHVNQSVFLNRFSESWLSFIWIISKTNFLKNHITYQILMFQL